ncbi:MAG: hypothetical protein WD800_03205 [Dehalococcoidia bacterium]
MKARFSLLLPLLLFGGCAATEPTATPTSSVDTLLARLDTLEERLDAIEAGLNGPDVTPAAAVTTDAIVLSKTLGGASEGEYGPVSHHCITYRLAGETVEGCRDILIEAALYEEAEIEAMRTRSGIDPIYWGELSLGAFFARCYSDVRIGDRLPNCWR